MYEAVVHLFSKPCNILLHDYISVKLTVLLVMDVWIVSQFLTWHCYTKHSCRCLLVEWISLAVKWLAHRICASLVFVDCTLKTKLLFSMVLMIDLDFHQQEMWGPIVVDYHKYFVLSDFLVSASLMVCLNVVLNCIPLVSSWYEMNGAPQMYQVLTPGNCDCYLIW